MKVLYVGNYKDGTGWASFAKNQILALDAAGVDVACRAIKLNSHVGPVHPKLAELEKKNAFGADAIIQNVLPHYSEYHSKFKKNILYYLVETSNFRATTWANHINLMDLAWVPCEHNKRASLDSGVEVPVDVVPMAVDTSKFEKSYDVLPIREKLGNKFVFYTIGEFNTRKNLKTLLRAFHTEFGPDEEVELFLKTTPTGLKNPQEEITNFINEVKTGLKIHKNITDYKKEMIVFDYVTEEDVAKIHTTFDCFISTSHGESVCVPAMDAMGFAKPTIVPDHGGFKEYTQYGAYTLPTHLDSVFGATDSLADVYTGREQWGVVTVPEVQRAMRYVFENRQLASKWGQSGFSHIYTFSLLNMGNVMKAKLEAIL